MTLSPWLVQVIEACIASCCVASTIALISICVFVGVVIADVREKG